jgi:hypothetical protein
LYARPEQAASQLDQALLLVKLQMIVVQRIEPDGTMSDTTRELTVYNPFGTAVGGSAYITCKFVNNGYWIVDAEDC